MSNFFENAMLVVVAIMLFAMIGCVKQVPIQVQQGLVMQSSDCTYSNRIGSNSSRSTRCRNEWVRPETLEIQTPVRQVATTPEVPAWASHEVAQIHLGTREHVRSLREIAELEGVRADQEGARADVAETEREVATEIATEIEYDEGEE